MLPLPARLADEVPFQGRIGVIYGLKVATSEICFVTSCDAPFLNLRSIRSLLAALGDADVAVPFLAELFAARARGIPQIGHGFAGAKLDARKLRPTFLYEQVKTRIVAEDEVCAWDPEGLSFVHIKHARDHQQALRRW